MSSVGMPPKQQGDGLAGAMPLHIGAFQAEISALLRTPSLAAAARLRSRSAKKLGTCQKYNATARLREQRPIT